MAGIGGGKKNIPVRVNLAAWYRLNNGIVNQSGCSQWADSSGNQRPLLQPTDSLRPAIRTGGGIVFDGVDDYMQATFTLAQPYTLYALFAQVTWTNNDIIIDGVTNSAGFVQTSSTPQITMNAGSSLAASSTIPLSKNCVACGVFNGANSVYQVGAGGPTVTITGDAGSNAAGGITIGASKTGTVPANVSFREIAIYTGAHDATTRLAILRYLGNLRSSVGGVM